MQSVKQQSKPVIPHHYLLPPTSITSAVASCGLGISPPRFLAECRKRRLNQGSFVLLCFVLFAFSGLCLVLVMSVFNLSSVHICPYLEPRQTNSSTTATCCPRTAAVNGSSSLLRKLWTFVSCQFTLSPRDAASDAIVSSAVQGGVQVAQ